jgi:prenyltransferase/squalene oxidase-like repeat protein
MRTKIASTTCVLSCGIFLLSTLAGRMNKTATIDNEVIKQSVAKTMLILQKSAYVFTNNNQLKCASCHNNTLTAMATEMAREKGIPVIDSLSAHNIAAMKHTLALACNPNKIKEFLTANFVIPYILLGLSAEKYPPDTYTDIAVDYIMSQAKPDGSFLAESFRVPLENGDIHLTAMAIRSIQLYASAPKKQQVNDLMKKTRLWLEQAQTDQQQELTFQLLGMHWCGSNKDQKNKIAQKLESMQNEDGGWSQLTTLKSDAYATGQILYALYESGMAKTDDPVYQKGLSYLLKTQNERGAWVLETRSFPIQPPMTADFPPYNRHEFISAAASNWAVMALMNALPNKTK